MGGAKKSAAKRRTIFPHLDESKSDESETTTMTSNKAKSTTDESSDDATAYDNAKSKNGKKQHPSARKTDSTPATNGGASSNAPTASNATPKETAAGAAIHHLIPLPLVFTVLICSGFFWVASFRDVMATGKPILDRLGVLWGQEDSDANYLQYTKSTPWYDDSRGWKSKQGGLSTIMTVTTDANDMGGLFLRKMAGAAGLAFHTTKLLPVVFQFAPEYDRGSGRWVGNSWSAGHFDPLIALGMIGDACVSAFYLGRLEELKNAGAGGIGMAYVLTSLVEAFVFGLFLLSRRMNRKATKRPPAESRVGSARGYDPKEDPNSLPSRIVARTVLIVSSLMGLISLRDLFFPGSILSFIPRDDIYLEWTGAFLHSPPPDTVEADEHGLEAPFFSGDKFVAQQMAMYLCLCCMFKFFSAWGWSKGNRFMGRVDNVDRSGMVSSKMIWKTQAIGDMMILSMMRLFTPAANSASLDLRWHLMFVAYEMFILFLYGYW